MRTATKLRAWLRSTITVRPQPFDLGAAIRASLCIGGPFLIGAAVDELRLFMWAALAGMFGTAGEQRTTLLRQTVRNTFFTLPFTFGTFMLGYARDAVSDWVAIGVLAVLSFVAGIICTWSRYAAVTAMQVLMIGSLITGMKNGDWLHFGISFVCGALFYLALYSIQAAILQRSKAYSGIAGPLNKLANKCEAQAASMPDDVAKESTAFIQAYMGASNSDLLSPRYRLVLAQLDQVEVDASECNDPAQLKKIAMQLRALAQQVSTGKVSGEYDQISDLYDAIADYVNSGETERHTKLFPLPRDLVATASRRHYANTVTNACRLGTAYTVGLILGHVLPFHHLFWVATTVAVVMTPQIGASVSRAIQRVVGTVVGVIVGTLVMVISVNHFWLSAVIAVLAFFLPWACSSSQIFKQFSMTPIILLLGDLIVPANNSQVFYGDERLFATFLGAVVIIVFGYLIWPSARHPNFSPDFQRVVAALAKYGQTVVDVDEERESTSKDNSVIDGTMAARTSVYDEISVFQQLIQPTIGEPPYTAEKTVKWIPAEISATRVCDLITKDIERPQLIQSIEPNLDALAKGRHLDIGKKNPAVVDLEQKINNADARFFSS